MANISELNSPYLTVIMMWHSSVNKTTHNAGSRGSMGNSYYMNISEC